MIVARVIRTFRDQGGGSILQVCSLTWRPLGRNHPNAIEGRATTDTPSTGVARRATHASRSLRAPAPPTRPVDRLDVVAYG